MPLTRDFRETVQARAAGDPAFREAMFQEAVESLLNGDLEGGRAALRSYINATIGFERLGVALGRPPKSLMRRNRFTRRRICYVTCWNPIWCRG